MNIRGLPNWFKKMESANIGIVYIGKHCVSKTHSIREKESILYLHHQLTQESGSISDMEH